MEERTGRREGRQRRGEGELAGCLGGLRTGIRDGVGESWGKGGGGSVLGVTRTHVAARSLLLLSRCKRLAGREGGVWPCER